MHGISAEGPLEAPGPQPKALRALAVYLAAVVLCVLCASIGSIMVTEAIKLITGIGEPLLGRLMLYDALEMSYRTITIRKDPSTPKITELIDYEEFCGVVPDDAA